MKRIPLLIAVALVLSAVGAAWGTTAASAKKGSTTFQWLVAEDPLCEDEGACPAISEAHNGFTVELTGEGVLGVHPKSVSGGGDFTIKDADGNVVEQGTWDATKLESFVSYGPLPEDPTLFGGKAVMDVEAFVDGVPVGTGILLVTCLVGNPPPGADEGIRLNARGLNFNREVQGETLYILQG